MAKFGQTDKHLWKTVTIAHVFAMEENVMLNVQGRYVHNLDVKIVTATFGQTDKHLMLMMAVTVVLVIVMKENAMLFALRFYVQFHLLDVKTVTAKFGSTDKHLLLMMGVTNARVFAMNESVMLLVH